MTPRILHFIWAGSGLPKLDIMLTWRKKNPDYQLLLWLNNKSTASSSLLSELEQHRISVKKISEAPSAPVEEHFAYSIESLRPNYGGGNDLMRYGVLRDFGNLYLDADEEPSAARPQSNYRIDNNDIGNDVFIAKAMSPLVNAFLKQRSSGGK